MKKVFFVLSWLGWLAVMANGQAPAVADKSAGSALLFERYASSAAQPAAADTWLRLDNTHASEAVTVRVLFFEQASLAEQVYLVRLAAGETVVWRASEFDPGVSGWVMAVACDVRGLPQQFNWLSGAAQG